MNQTGFFTLMILWFVNVTWNWHLKFYPPINKRLSSFLWKCERL